jgi:hypothetical protein
MSPTFELDQDSARPYRPVRALDWWEGALKPTWARVTLSAATAKTGVAGCPPIAMRTNSALLNLLHAPTRSSSSAVWYAFAKADHPFFDCFIKRSGRPNVKPRISAKPLGVGDQSATTPVSWRKDTPSIIHFDRHQAVGRPREIAQGGERWQFVPRAVDWDEQGRQKSARRRRGVRRRRRAVARARASFPCCSMRPPAGRVLVRLSSVALEDRPNRCCLCRERPRAARSCATKKRAPGRAREPSRSSSGPARPGPPATACRPALRL